MHPFCMQMRRQWHEERNDEENVPVVRRDVEGTDNLVVATEEARAVAAKVMIKQAAAKPGSWDCKAEGLQLSRVPNTRPPCGRALSLAFAQKASATAGYQQRWWRLRCRQIRMRARNRSRVVGSDTA
jgi:hypothetical protein